MTATTNEQVDAPGWVRAAIRTAEIAIIQVPLVAILSSAVIRPDDSEFIANGTRNAIALFVTPIVWVLWLRVIEPLLVEATGNSPLKALAGIEVIDKRTLKRASAMAWRKRNKRLWASIWFGMPFLWAVGAAILALKLRRGVEEPHNADANTRVVVTDKEKAQVWAAVFWALYIVLLFVG